MHYLQHRFHAMGSPCSIHLYAHDQAAALAAAHLVENEVLRLERKYSRYRDDSITAALQVAAREGRALAVDSETAALLDYAQVAWEQSDGLFDITSGVLRHAWSFSPGVARSQPAENPLPTQNPLPIQNPLPTQARLEELLARVGWQHVRRQQGEVSFDRPGMEIDFGGFVKEYAADCAAAIALQAGIRHGLVELGGDIRVIGPHPDGRPWSVGIRHPRLPGQVWATISLQRGALASSGDYERCLIHNGVRYGHILNPFTGWPVQALIAVSAVADHCLLAGSVATLALLHGEQGLAWLEEGEQPWLAMAACGAVHGNLALQAAVPGVR